MATGRDADRSTGQVPVVAIRDAAPGDFAAICALNLAEVQHTSPMDAARLGALHRMAAYHKVGTAAGHVVAFLLAMRSCAPYANDNFEWFARKYPSFLYVDRIVVSADVRGLRLGTLLYEDLFRFARVNAVPLVTCEYNIFPPNEPSRRFHDKFGFREQGTQWVQSDTKQVSLQAAQT
ncbi:MAG: GNAT family N-acetyltransferase [Proteobacteria bacterium]|nr:GNAT family N-acetyltransferase [Pseudomonadota bacterium]